MTILGWANIIHICLEEKGGVVEGSDEFLLIRKVEELIQDVQADDLPHGDGHLHDGEHQHQAWVGIARIRDRSAWLIFEIPAVLLPISSPYQLAITLLSPCYLSPCYIIILCNHHFFLARFILHLKHFYTALFRHSYGSQKVAVKLKRIIVQLVFGFSWTL